MPELAAGASVRVRLFGEVREVTILSVGGRTFRARFGTRDGRVAERTFRIDRIVTARPAPASPRKAYSVVRRHVAGIIDPGTTEALDALKVLRPPPAVHTKRDVIDELEELASSRARAERRALRPHPKPSKPARSALYMEFVRQQPCCHCDAPPRSDPHHFGRRGVGQKTTDFGCVPLCRKCHDHVTDHNTLPGLTLHATEVLCLRTLVTLLQRFEARR